MLHSRGFNGVFEAAGRAPRLVLYSHDTLGFGHLRRNLLLAGALRHCARTPEILLICGMREAGAFELPQGVDCVTLPAYAKDTDGNYRPRDLGKNLASLTALRAQTIRATVQAFDPDLMIVDNVPRGALFELDLTLAAMDTRRRTRLVLGLRDVIDRPAVVRRQWLRQRNFETVRRYYEAVWIYGDPTLYDIASECGLSHAFAGKARHVGYLDPTVRCASPQAGVDAARVLGGDRSPYILCAVGGGRDGAALCEAFARAPLPARHRGILVTGTQMPVPMRERIQKLVAQRSDITLVPFLREPIALMAGAARVISMGGYNTTCEVLALGRPALIVPRAWPREEQLIRAERLAARGLTSMMHPGELTPEALGNWMCRPAPRPSGARVDMSGLERVKTLADELLLPAEAAACAS